MVIVTAVPVLATDLTFTKLGVRTVPFAPFVKFDGSRTLPVRKSSTPLFVNEVAALASRVAPPVNRMVPLFDHRARHRQRAARVGDEAAGIHPPRPPLTVPEPWSVPVTLSVPVTKPLSVRCIAGSDGVPGLGPER